MASFFYFLLREFNIVKPEFEMYIASKPRKHEKINLNYFK